MRAFCPQVQRPSALQPWAAPLGGLRVAADIKLSFECDINNKTITRIMNIIINIMIIVRRRIRAHPWAARVAAIL